MKAIYDNLHKLNTSHGFAEDSNPFIVQEIIDLGIEKISKYEYTDMGAVTEFIFSNEIGKAFNGKTPLKLLK